MTRAAGARPLHVVPLVTVYLPLVSSVGLIAALFGLEASHATAFVGPGPVVLAVSGTLPYMAAVSLLAAGRANPGLALASGLSATMAFLLLPLAAISYLIPGPAFAGPVPDWYWWQVGIMVLLLLAQVILAAASFRALRRAAPERSLTLVALGLLGAWAYLIAVVLFVRSVP